ncbi:class I SAM-dependent methyltransferase [SAR92 clade bacterium H921]|nr:class I SAM-dependent methyltransferase [SAR92 clade bacterium H921]
MEHQHTHTGWGTTSHLLTPCVLPLLIESGSRELLDYGAGKGTLKNAPELQGYTVHEYDPAISKISMTPDPCDFVVCLDVLEHIEPECLRNVMEDLKRVVIQHGYLVVSLVPAFTTLSDGRNAHIMLREAPWWRDFIGQYFKIDSFKLYGLKSGSKYPWADGLYPYANVHITISPRDT